MTVDYGNLNPEQLRIVLEGDGPALVVAGPGSGKTRTLVYRVCKIMESGTSPENILLLTFTNKAAREMKARAEFLIGSDAKRLTAGTFHHFANILLRKHASVVGLEKNFTIMDEEDSLALLKQAVLEHQPSVKKGVVDSIARAISLSKLKMLSLPELFESPDFFHLRNHADEIQVIASTYEKLKKSMNVVDFDDLLVFSYKALQNPKVRESRKFTDILVDEFQDTDRLQAAIVDLLHEPGTNLMVVGDDSQSIYSFRGAEIRNILEFREKYEARLFMLVRNYRSSPQIVSLINHTINSSGQKIEKSLVASNDPGRHPSVHQFIDRPSEAIFIADNVARDLESGKKVGVLFRAAYLASELEVELARRGISYSLRGGIRFFEQKHVKDLLSLLKAYQNPRDRPSLVRLFTLFPRIGEKSVMKHEVSTLSSLLWTLKKIDKSGVYSDLLSSIYSEGGNAAAMLDNFYSSFYRKYMEENFDDHEERKPDVEALIGAAARFDSVEKFLEAFSLEPEPPGQKETPLVLSTIHQAKGLEWDSVYLMGLADGLLPLARSNDIEEERRLFYVAASRAKSTLVMTYSLSNGRFYGFESLEPSRFLRELPEGVYTLGE